MGSITVDVSEVAQKLDPRTLEKALTSALGDAASLVREEAKRYPAPVPTYTRTFTLFKGWTQRVANLQAIIGNAVAYAPYVQDADQQAWMHRGRWQTTTDIARKKTIEVKRTIEQALIRWAS